MKPWDLNLRHLRAFVMTARLGTVMAAARAIHLSQPAVTQAVTRLEDQLATLLFTRRPDGMTPNEAAHAFLPRVESALALIRSPRITATQAKAFVALARAGSYAAAAQLAGPSPASLHRSVTDLEFAIDAPLVERRGRGLELTRQGHRLARALRLAHVELQAGLDDLAALAGRETGRITVGAMPLSRAKLLPATVVAFQKHFPHVAIAISEGSHAELIEPLRDGDLDLLIGALREPSPGPDVTQSPLFVDCPVIIGRAGHPLAQGRRKDPRLADIGRYPWIVPAPGTPLRDQWRQMFEAAGMATPDVPVECGSVMTIRQILMQSDCLTILSPDQVAPELEAGWLTVIGKAPADLRRTIGVTARAGWQPTRLQAAFIDALRQQAQAA